MRILGEGRKMKKEQRERIKDFKTEGKQGSWRKEGKGEGTFLLERERNEKKETGERGWRRRKTRERR